MTEFTRLIEPEVARLRPYARALTRDAERAEDLVQNCLVRALAKQHLWKPGTDLRAWLFTIMHNARVSDLRRSAREEARSETAVTLMPPVPRQPDARLDVLDADRAMGELPVSQRRALLLVCLEDMSYDQAASVLGVPVGTVRSRLGRARAALRNKLGHPAIGDHRPATRTKPALARRLEPHLATA